MTGEARLSRADFLRKIPGIFFQRLESFQETEQDQSAAEVKKSGEGFLPQVDISRCLAWGQMECQLCYLACPHREQAIEMRDHKPVIIAAGCDGCAVCVEACLTINDSGAIRMIARPGAEKIK